MLRALRIGRFSPEEVQVLMAGRAVDTTKLRTEVGFEPRFTTASAFDDFAHTLVPAIDRDAVRRAEVRVAAGLGVLPESEFPAALAPAPQGRAKLVGIPGERADPGPVGRRRRS